MESNNKVQNIEQEIKNEVKNIIENEIENSVDNIKNEIENSADNIKNEIENTLHSVIETSKNDINQRIINNLATSTSVFSKLVNPYNNLASLVNKNKLNEMNDIIKNNEMLNFIQPGELNSKEIKKSVNNSRRESKIDIKDENKNENKDENKDENLPVLTTRNRKQDRRNLANDINSELPISIRFNDSINIDNNEVVENYISDWTQFENEDTNKLDILIEEIFVNEEKYKGLSNFNYNCARSIQFTLILMGMLGIFLQAKGASPETVNNFTIASSGITTLTTSLLTFFSFSKKSPHYSKISFMLRRLRNWIEKLIVVPVNKRVSPYDLYVISKIAFESILTEAREGLTDNK